MSIDSNEVQQLFSSIVPLVNNYGYQERQTPAASKNECRWMIASVLAPKISGVRKADAPLLSAVSRSLNAQFGRGFGVPCLRDWLEVYRAFPDRDEIRFELTWAHYLALSNESDCARRTQLMQKAIERKWSVASLAARISNAPRGYGCQFEICDGLILDLARTYSCSCGILSVEELKSIYHEACNSPVDDFDFQETLLYMNTVSTDKDEPCLWKYQGITYVMDRALADPTTTDEPRYDYGCEWGWNRSYVRPSAFLGALRKSYEGYVERRRIELIGAHAGIPASRPERTVGEAHGLPSLLHWRDVEHLREYCIGNVVAGRSYSDEYETAFARGIEQLVRHVSQHGIPSDDEIDEDASFLLARTHYSRDYWDRHEHRSSQYVAGILKSIYWQVPLWEENGRSARELDEESLGDAA